MALSIGNRGVKSKGLFSAFLLVVASCFLSTHAFSQELFNFDIPVTDASSAIRELSRQTGNPTIFQSDDVESVEINALRGSYTLRQALDILLAGTGLSGDLTEGGVITISRNDPIADGANSIEDGNESGKGIFGAILGFFSEDSDETAEPLQDEATSDYVLEEIVVTGRKREEALQDIPVSISVVSADVIAEQNVLSLDDLAEIVPGFHYNQGEAVFDDRLAALPGIRGVSSTEIATNRTKVSSFVDGMPIIGSVGPINIGGATQVEVYRGPQSAAFGRSTFAGAINYVTADPGEELEGAVSLNWSDQGTRILSGNLGGPLSSSLGFQLSGNYENSVPPEQDLYSYSDGVETNTRGGTNASIRFLWEPTNKVSAKLTFARDRTDDGPATSNFLATQQSSAACFNSLDTFEYAGGMGAATGVLGEFDCELNVDRDAPLIAVHDISRYYEQSPEAFESQVQAARDAGATDGELGGFSVEEAITLIAEAYSIPHRDAGTISDRSRVLSQFEYLFDTGAQLQLSMMKSDEESSRNFTRYLSPTPYDIVYIPATSETNARYRYGPAMGGQFAETSVNEVEETYLEIRWVSSGEERLRYLFGGAYYEYDYLAEVYRDGGFNALSLGTQDVILELTQTVIAPDSTFSEFTENVAAFFNASYDFTDKVTASIEGRYALDKVGGRLASDPSVDPEYIKSRSFTPRIALNYSPDEKTTYYFQYAEGVNPGGINASLLDPTVMDLLDNGVPVELDPNDPDSLTPVVSVNYDSSTYLSFDEETLTNFELGLKGAAWGDRLHYAGAIYHMIWKDAVQPINLDWDYTYADNDLIGVPVPGLTDTFYTAETFGTSARVSANSGTSKTTGFELQARLQVNENWSLSLSGSYMRARHSDFCSVALFTGNSGDLGDVAGLAQGADSVGNGCYVLDGKKLVRQPEATLSFTPRYRVEIGNGMQLNASARMQYVGKTYLDAANLSRTPATSTLNFNLRLAKDNWSGTFYAENLFDDQTVTSAAAIPVARYNNQYVATGVAPAADTDLLFRTNDGAATNYSHLSYRIPIGRILGFRADYRF